MGKIHWNIAASIGLMIFSQTASAAPDGAGAMRLVANVSQDFSVAVNDHGARPDFNMAGFTRLAQASEPKQSETSPVAAPASPPADLKGPNEPSPPAAAAAPPGTVTATATKSAPSVPGCALHYLAAELSGKLKGRKWKQFRAEECGESETSAVFPTAVAPKYSAEKPDKAMTLTCADQFNANKANKAANANGGLKWIEKSGGYYSECIVRLKG
jgi:hypothetical protein